MTTFKFINAILFWVIFFWFVFFYLDPVIAQTIRGPDEELRCVVVSPGVLRCEPW